MVKIPGFLKASSEYSQRDAYLDLIGMQGKKLSYYLLAEKWGWERSAVSRFIKKLSDGGFLVLKTQSKGFTINLPDLVSAPKPKAKKAKAAPKKIVKKPAPPKEEPLPIPSMPSPPKEEVKPAAEPLILTPPPPNDEDPPDLLNEKNAYKKLEKTKKNVWDFLKTRPLFIDPYIDLWNMLAEERHYPKVVNKETQSRKLKFKTRIKESAFDFIAIIKKISDSRRLTGAAWFNYDWVMENDKNYVRILEGVYDKPFEAKQEKSNPNKIDQDAYIRERNERMAKERETLEEEKRRGILK